MGWSGWFDILQKPADCSKVKPSHDDVLVWNNSTKHWEPKNRSTVSATDPFYFGDPDTNGTWRIIRSGDNLAFQRREAGLWVSKGKMLA